MKKISMFDYYNENEFNPTKTSVESKAVFAQLIRNRLNLYSNKLKIPQGFWRDREVLEVGPSSGENALVLARLGARFTFIEPMGSSVKRLRYLFKYFGLGKQIGHIHTRQIQNMSLPKHHFDCVIAEGFLFSLPQRRLLLNRLITSLKKGGLLSLSTMDPVGSFSEYFKKYVFVYLCRKAGAQTLNKQLAIAKQLFLKEYGKIPHSRAFELWIRDNFINPAFEFNCMWGLPEILSDAGNKVRVFSSWPRAEHACDMTWYKRISNLDDQRKETLVAYTLRLPSFFHGKTSNDGEELSSLKNAKLFARATMSSMKAIFDFTRTNKSRETSRITHTIKELRSKTDFLREKRILEPVLNDIEALSTNPTIAMYRKSVHLRNCWGVSYPYYVLEKV